MSEQGDRMERKLDELIFLIKMSILKTKVGDEKCEFLFCCIAK